MNGETKEAHYIYWSGERITKQQSSLIIFIIYVLNWLFFQIQTLILIKIFFSFGISITLNEPRRQKIYDLDPCVNKVRSPNALLPVVYTIYRLSFSLFGLTRPSGVRLIWLCFYFSPYFDCNECVRISSQRGGEISREDQSEKVRDWFFNCMSYIDIYRKRQRYI